MAPSIHIYGLYARVKPTGGSLVHIPAHLRTRVGHLQEPETLPPAHPHMSVMEFELSVNRQQLAEPNPKCPSVEVEF